jgi:small subunit ribosomal protein S9
MLSRAVLRTAEALSGRFVEIGQVTSTAVLRCLGTDVVDKIGGRSYSDQTKEGVNTTGEENPSSSTKDWTTAMDAGDWDAAWEIFSSEERYQGMDFPALEDLLDWDPDGAEKEIRRQKEMDFQDRVSKSRVRKIDEQGVAHGVGKRKTSVARVWIKEGIGHCVVNKKPFDIYFPDMLRRNDVITPLIVANALGKFDVMATIQGGGTMGQSQAMRHGIARALQNWDPELRGVLKESGLLSRDARIVERKKPGRAKARKSFAWVKR